MGRPSALVIGAGIGGIATAARLAAQGYRVTVTEKCDRPGGRCGRVQKDGHRFVTGPSLFLMPEIYAGTFADLGQRMEDHLDLRRVDPTYHLHFSDGSSLALTSDLQAMRDQLEAIEPGSFGSFLRYLDEGYRHYELSLSHLVRRNFRTLREYCNPANLLLLFKLKALIKHYHNVGKYFHDPRLKAAFTFQDIYLGLSPFEAPAIYSLLQYTELAEGVWFPMGGMCRVVEVLADIAEGLGVQFLYDAPVARIDVEGRRARGVTLVDGRRLRADTLVANADLPYVYRCLLPDEGAARRLERKRYSCSVVMFCWGVSKQLPQFGPHHLFLVEDYRRNFDQIFKGFAAPDDPSFYVHAPVRLDPSMAPAGEDTLTVIVPVGHMCDDASQNWTAIRERTRRAVLDRLSAFGVSDLEAHLKFELCFTPPDWQARFNLAKGATHGLSHHLLQMGYLRPRNRHGRYRNLYFVGASTHPGTGLPTVLVSAQLVTERILEDVGAPQRIPTVKPVPVLNKRTQFGQAGFDRLEL